MTGLKGKRKPAEPVAATEARDTLTQLLNRAKYAGDRFVITANGKPQGAIVGLDDLAKLEGAT
jgi:prevent-host-death family protein